MPTFFENKDFKAIIDGNKTNDEITEGQKLKLYVVNDLLKFLKYLFLLIFYKLMKLKK